MAKIMDRAVDMAKVMLERGVEVQRIQAQQRKMLIAPGFESDADAGDINAEFQPETVGEVPDADPDAQWEELVTGADAEVAPVESQVRVCTGCGGELTDDDEGPQCTNCVNFDAQDKGQQQLI